MYQITCDDYVLHNPMIEELKVIGAKCSLEVNKTGLLTFQIAPTHPYYDKIQKHTSQIKLYQDDKILFWGRVLNDEITFDNVKNVECEGELSYLLDSIQRGKEYHLDGGTENVIKTYLKQLVAIHNSQVDDSKKFTVGTVNVTDTNNYLYKISNYEDTLTTLTDKLLDTYGGFFQIRHTNGVRYIDYLTELTNSCNQTIEFGKNIIDMTKYIKGEDIYTALIPLGAKKETDDTTTTETYDKRLKITSLADTTDGTIKKVKDYIYDTEAVKKWGWIWKVRKWDDVKVKENLLSKAKKELKNAIKDTLSIEMTAIDLHLLNVNIDMISVGDKIQCISRPHNLNTTLIVKSIDIDIDNPQNTKIKLVSATSKIKKDKTITEKNKNSEKDVTKVKDDLSEDYPKYTDLDNSMSKLKEWANDTFLPMGSDGSVDLSDYVKQSDLANYPTKSDLANYPTKMDLSKYAKITDVNTAFSELATAIEGV